MPKLLIIEDENELADAVADMLRAEGYEVAVAYDGKTAMDLYHQDPPDLVILDLMLPEAHGFDLLREMRSQTNVPVIMVTAKGEEIDRVLGIELGADDYVVKPFSMRELAARVKVVLRRAGFEV